MRFTAILLLMTTLSFASVKDSLLSVIDTGTVKQQTTACIKLEQAYRNNQPDSALYFIDKAYSIVTKHQLDTLLFSVYGNLAITYKLKGNYDTTLYFLEKSLNLAHKLKDTSAVAVAYNNLGVFYDDLGKRAEALKYFLQSAEISEERGDSAEIALSYNNIGLIHYKNKNYQEAERYYRNSLAIKESLGDVKGTALLYNNLGILYYFEDQPQECINYFKKALKIWRTAGNKRQMAMVLSNIGELYYEIRIYQAAKNYLLESLQIYKQLEDINGELYELNLLGEIEKELGHIDQSIIYFEQAYEKALLTQSGEDLQRISHNLYEVYQKKNKYQLSNKYLELYVAYKDSLMSVEKERIMQDLNKQYETEKKEQEIEILNNKNKLIEEKNKRNEAEINRQKIVNISLIIGVILILIVIVLIIRENRIRKKNNEMLLEKNVEIQFQHAEISEQKDEIETQRDVVNAQKEQIEQIHKHVSQSIDYAERIQNSTLPSTDILDQYFSENFVLFKPRDIVSGDFYWWTHVEGQTVITAADSTGHGVPGAFMSLLGMSFLKEIIVKEYITHPGVILRKLRKEVVNTLKQKGNIGEQKDGMDMALVSINYKTKLLQYAGANNSLYIIADREIEGLKPLEGLDGFYEIKPDKMPIAIYDKMNRFTTHEVQLEIGDQIYMFSDGYPDQFGGPKGKKFKYKAFKELLIKNAHLPMQEQQQILDETLKNWMKNEDQVDDIVIVGVKI